MHHESVPGAFELANVSKHESPAQYETQERSWLRQCVCFEGAGQCHLVGGKAKLEVKWKREIVMPSKVDKIITNIQYFLSF